MSPLLSESRRIIAIGDIHGCLMSLKKLIDKINPEPGEQFVFSGDLIDRGPSSKGVIDYLVDLSLSCSCHFLMGNHELLLLEYLETLDPVRWLENGGRATLDSYNSPDGLDMAEEHIAFFRNCHYFIETEHHFFTHGGLDPGLTIKDNLRLYSPKEFCRLRMHMHPALLETQNYPWQKTLVCAHTPVPEPIMLEKLIAIDTGCIYKDNPMLGRLTAVILPERRIIQTRNLD
ncbi:MAG: serine/threonine protein phosphatase [Chlorobium sp.]|nr:MAG: serine/threonine protein phosphatase [Chlorobium sp.]